MLPFSRPFHAAVAFAATAALVACGGSAIPSGGVADLAPSAAHASTCKQPPKTYVFTGPCKEISLTDAAVSIKLPAYHGVTITFAFPKPKKVSPPTPFGVADATGKSDILALNGKTFNRYSGYGGKAIAYLKFFDGGKSSVEYFVTPQIKITYKGSLTGKKCTLSYRYSATGWADTATPSTVTTHGIAFASSAIQAGFNISAGGAKYLVVSCQ